VPKRTGTLNCVPESVSVFDVTAEVADAGVEDVAQRILAKEKVAEYSRTPGVLIVYP